MNLVRSLALLVLCFQSLGAQDLSPRLNDNQLTVASPKWNFLEGKVLERLRNGQSVTFDFQLQLLDGPKTLTRSLQRFVLSYDLWEETFSAVHLSQLAPRTPVDSILRLKREDVAGWCLGRMKLPLPTIDKLKPLTLQLEIRSAGPKLANPLRPQGNVDLGVLVEVFSRPADPKESRFTARSQSFTLGALTHP